MILYFYDQHHELSKRQGYVLDTLVNSEGIQIFSFDRSFEIIDFLINRYEVEESPTVIVNEGKKFSGFVNLVDLREFLLNN